MFRLAIALTGFFLLASYAWGQQSALYRITDLGDLPGGEDASFAIAINDKGQVVGNSGASGGRNPFLWSKKTGMVGLGTLPGDVSAFALDISNTGYVVGRSVRSSPSTTADFTAFVWDAEFGIRDLDQAAGLTGGSIADAVSNDGTVVGVTALASNFRSGQAFAYTDFTGMEILLPPLSRAFDINGGEDIVGQYYDGLFQHGFVQFADGTFIDLGDPSDEFGVSRAAKINNKGIIIGQAGLSRTVVWNSAGNRIANFGEGAVMLGLNNRNQIVGRNYNSGAVIWNLDDNTEIDLNSVVDPSDPLYGRFHLYSAYDINNAGWIVGYGHTEDGTNRAFLLTPQKAR